MVPVSGLAYVSILSICSVHVIVFESSSYVPPARSESSTSISYGSLSTMFTVASPIYLFITP